MDRNRPKREQQLARYGISATEFERVKGLANSLPDVRVERVVGVRKALRENRYDSDEKLDETIRKLAVDLKTSDE